jgi:hypothetical protein
MRSRETQGTAGVAGRVQVGSSLPYFAVEEGLSVCTKYEVPLPKPQISIPGSHATNYQFLHAIRPGRAGSLRRHPLIPSAHPAGPPKTVLVSTLDDGWYGALLVTMIICGGSNTSACSLRAELEYSRRIRAIAFSGGSSALPRHGTQPLRRGMGRLRRVTSAIKHDLAGIANCAPSIVIHNFSHAFVQRSLGSTCVILMSGK